MRDDPTSRAIRKAHREYRAAKRSYRLTLTSAFVGAVCLALCVGGAVQGHSNAVTGILAASALFWLAWTAASLTYWTNDAGALDKAHDSLVDALDAERARLTRDAERALLAFEARKNPDE